MVKVTFCRVFFCLYPAKGTNSSIFHIRLGSDYMCIHNELLSVTYLRLLVLVYFRRGISNQGLKHEYNKRRMSRDLITSKDMLSLKSREGLLLFKAFSSHGRGD